MPDEEHLGGFSHMGFHVIAYVIRMNVVEWWMFMHMFDYVDIFLSYIITVTVIVECMLQYEWMIV